MYFYLSYVFEKYAPTAIIKLNIMEDIKLTNRFDY